MRLLNMVEEEDTPQDMPEHDYSMVLTMASSELQKVVREMIPNGETLRVVCEVMEDGRQQVSFQSRGDAGDMTYFVDMEQQDTEVEDFERIDMEVRSRAPKNLACAYCCALFHTSETWSWTSLPISFGQMLHGLLRFLLYLMLSILCTQRPSTLGGGMWCFVIQSTPILLWLSSSGLSGI